MMKFGGTYQDLQDYVDLIGVAGRWRNLREQKQYRANNKGVLNYWESTRTINFQGPIPARRKLKAAFLRALDGKSAVRVERIDGASSHNALGATVLPAVTIYTDGACSGNPGPGGWAAILTFNGRTKELNGGEPMTTNNRMELTAAIRSLEVLHGPHTVHLYTDSQYLRNGITRWITKWKRNGWRTSSKKAVKNKDLWQRLDSAIRRHEIRWQWVRGHAGNRNNERADRLARRAIHTGSA